MKLLIITQRVDANDDNLGAFYQWFERFSKYFEHVTILTSFRGEVSLPGNVSVYSFGKEKGYGRLRRFWTFLELFSRHYARCDIVLFHMIPEYVLAVLPFLISLKRRTALWYAHKSVTRTLRYAEHFVDYILTSSPAGFRMPSKKVFYVGQAINTDLFIPVAKETSMHSSALRMITFGRISPIKDLDVMVRSCALLKGSWPHQWTLSVVGGPITKNDEEYCVVLKKLVQEKGLADHIHFLGPRPYREMPGILKEHDLFLNMSRTGSLDKTVLEAMSSGLSVIVSNEAYVSVVPPAYFLEHSSPEFLAGRIKSLAFEERPNLALRSIVIEKHGLENTIRKIVSILTSPL